jgi:signal transduction histidine kinase
MKHGRNRRARQGHHRATREPRRLRQRLFFTFGLAILVAMATAGLVFGVFHGAAGTRPWLRPLSLLSAGFVLWVFAGVAAHRIAAPLAELARAAAALGGGKLERRAREPVRGAYEVRELARAFNDMAGRIERQLRNQKELIGAVSHELRTPLARVRIVLAMLQESGADPTLIAKLEREIGDMDSLVGELLAGARVDAGALTRRRLDLGDVLRECVERAGLPNVQLQLAPSARTLEADATLVSRAVAVLLDNATKHGGAQLRVCTDSVASVLRIYVEDDGRGFDPTDLPTLFEPFVRGRGADPDEHRGVGLGLYLVRRIAEAHGGQAFAENRAEGGARVGLALPQRPDAAA